MQVRGLAGLTLETASGRHLSLDRGPGGLRARYRNARGDEREWTILGASRGEAGILGEGIRQALLRDTDLHPRAACGERSARRGRRRRLHGRSEMTGEPLVTMVADEAEAAERAAEVLATALDASRTVHGVAHASLAGGSTPLRAYELLGERLPDWSDVHFWFGDERCVPPDDEESTFRMVRERLDVPGAEIHRCRGELGPDAAAAEYADALRDVVLDVALLGMGPDGHTASLFPGHEALRAEGIAVGVRNSPKPPPERVTLTLPYLNSARRIVLLTTGAVQGAGAGPGRRRARRGGPRVAAGP